MTLTKSSRIFASGDATTLYLTLPAAVVSDSRFPFGADETVRLTIEDDTLRIAPLTERTEAERAE